MTEVKEIPEVRVVENKVALPVLEVPIVFNGEQKMVKLQRLSAGQRRDALKKHLITKIRGNQTSGDINDPIGIQISLLSKIIIEAPFEHSEAGLTNLPENVLDYLYNSYEDWTKKKQTSID